MSYPTRLLTDDEEVVREFHAHWRVLLPPLGIAVALFVAAGVVGALAGDTMLGSWSLGSVAWLTALVVSILVAIQPLVAWWFTRYVLTTERIMVRRGVIARSGIEIPLENINNVHYSQRAFERLLGYGDVLLESAGATGQSHLGDIPDPQQFQSEIYSARERRMFTLERGGGGESAPRDVAEQLTQLSALHDAGKLTDDEFAVQKRRLLGS